MADLVERIRAKLDEMIEDPGKSYESCAGCEYDCNCRECMTVHAVVLGILELHKPVGGFLLHCGECFYPDTTAQAWPCDTVEAVVKALGIEATDA